MVTVFNALPVQLGVTVGVTCTPFDTTATTVAVEIQNEFEWLLLN